LYLIIQLHFMKRYLPLLALLTIIIYSCSNNEGYKSTLLNRQQLKSQLFTVDIGKDTVLQTQKGAIVKIPKGALVASENTVQLEIKEAYSLSDIILAGLTTQSNGQLLSSGGMIYINAVGGSSVKITQALSVAIPTSNMNKDMQLYKGKENASGDINWDDATSLPANPQVKAMDAGEALFKQSCTSCHAIGKNGTGPDLAHVVKRYEKMYAKAPDIILDTQQSRYVKDHARAMLYNYTRNNLKVMADGSKYHRCLYESRGRAAMNLFPGLTDKDLDGLYAYIENESEKRNLPIPENGIMNCIDSCETYNQLKGRLTEVKRQLEKDSVQLAEIENRNQSIQPIANDDTANNFVYIAKALELVDLLDNKSLYYQFTVESFGWYNVDMLIKQDDGNVKSELMVRVTGQYKERFNIYLVIPSAKIFAGGGKIKGQSDRYGFALQDGTIYLPQGAKSYIIAIGEYEDKIIFSKKEFTTSTKHLLDMELATTTKELFNNELNLLSLPDINMEISETKNANELRKVIKDLKKAEDIKPKNCDCACSYMGEGEGQPMPAEYRAK
jgi:cytochrome c551/c552